MLPVNGPFPFPFGPYSVERFLKPPGGMALVFQAREWDRQIALKVPLPEVA
jgi:hypothetical protein